MIITLVGFSLLLITIIVAFSQWNVPIAFSSITTGTEQASLEVQQVEANATELANMSTGNNDAHINNLSGYFWFLKTRVALLFFTILLTSAGFLLGFVIYIHRTVTIPLSRLREGANEIRRGNLDYRVTVQGTSDIARLAGQFNEMTDTLKRANKDLERKLFERDITEQRHLQEVLVKAERLGAIEQAGVAVRHEINNPLTIIIGNLELLIERYEQKDKDLTARLEVVLNNALRIAEITKRLQENKMEKTVESEIT